MLSELAYPARLHSPVLPCPFLSSSNKWGWGVLFLISLNRLGGGGKTKSICVQPEQGDLPGLCSTPDTPVQIPSPSGYLEEGVQEGVTEAQKYLEISCNLLENRTKSLATLCQLCATSWHTHSACPPLTASRDVSY